MGLILHLVLLKEGILNWKPFSQNALSMVCTEREILWIESMAKIKFSFTGTAFRSGSLFSGVIYLTPSTEEAAFLLELMPSRQRKKKWGNTEEGLTNLEINVSPWESYVEIVKEENIINKGKSLQQMKNCVLCCSDQFLGNIPITQFRQS